MKKMKKLLSVVMAMAMMMTLVVSASATEGEGKGTITITNAADGATYNFYKLFDAKVIAGEHEDGKGIAYTGEIPTELGAYFVKDDFDQITAAEGVEEVSEEMQKALLDWAKAQTEPTATASGAQAKNGVSVPYGYYVILSNVGGGSAVTVDSTNPNAEVTDKNTTENPVWPDKGKTVDGVVFEMGKTATYTVTLKTVNWVPGANTGDPAVKVTEYTITDDFADDKLTDVNVTSIKIGDKTTITGADAQFKGGKIVLPWVDDTTKESLYEEGVNIIITYTATVSGTGEITNKVHASYKTGDTSVGVPNDPTATIYNSTIIVNKYTGNNKDDKDSKLAGAKFVLQNKTEGDINYDKYYKNDGGKVTWVDEKNADVFTSDENGAASIPGLADGKYALIETEAPAGYNKLTGTVNFEVDADGEDHTVEYVGNVQNNIGTELPGTGGMGTTIFTVVGGMLMVGAAVLFVTKKRSED